MANDNSPDNALPDFTQYMNPEDVQKVLGSLAGATSTNPRNVATPLQADVKQAAATQAAPTPQPSMTVPQQQGQQQPMPPQFPMKTQDEPTPMVKGGVPASQAGGPPKPTIGGLPGLIADLINPGRGVVAGNLVPSKAERFEGFITNFLTAMSQGLSQEGHGPGAMMRGMGAAMQAPYQQQVQQFGMQQQYEQQKAALDIERQKAQAMIPNIDVIGPRGEQLRISAQQLPQYMVAGYRFKGQEVAAKARTDVANINAQNKLEVEALKTHLLQGTASKFIPDVDKDGGRFYHVYNKFGQEIGRADVNAIPQFTGRTTSTYELKQQEDGSYIRIPKVTQNEPILPNRQARPGSAAGGGVAASSVNKGGKNYWATSDARGGYNKQAAVPVLDAQGNPIFGKAPENIRTMSYTANATLPHIDDLMSQIDELDKMGVLGQIKGKWTDFTSKHGFAVPGLTAEQRQAVGKFVNDVKLMDSAMLRTHFGARGGQQMYDKFSEMLNAGEDVDLMKGGLGAFKDYLSGYSDMINQQTNQAKGKTGKAAPQGNTSRKYSDNNPFAH